MAARRVMTIDTSLVTVVGRAQMIEMLTNSYADYFVRNLVAILGEMRAGLEILEASASHRPALNREGRGQKLSSSPIRYVRPRFYAPLVEKKCSLTLLIRAACAGITSHQRKPKPHSGDLTIGPPVGSSTRLFIL